MKKRIISLLLAVCTVLGFTVSFADDVDLRTYSIECFKDVDYSVPEAKRIAYSRLLLNKIARPFLQEDGGYAYPNNPIENEEFMAVYARTLGCNYWEDVKRADTELSHKVQLDSSEWSLVEYQFLLNHNYIPDYFISLGHDDGSFNNIETIDNNLFCINYQKAAQLKWAVVSLVRLAGYEEVAVANGGHFDGYFKTAVDIGLFDNTRFEAYENHILDYQNSNITRSDALLMLDKALSLPIYGKSYSGYQYYHKYGCQQLPAPVLGNKTTELKVGDDPFVSWYAVANADYYTVWDWNRNQPYDTENPYFMDLPSFTEPGVYAISVYARSYADDIFLQSEPASFNIYVESGGGSFSPTPQQGNPNPGDVINEVVHTDIAAYIYSHYIPSYNIDGYTAVIAEDLIYYGFNVEYDNNTRSLYINAGDKVVTTNYKVSENTAPIGSKYMDVLYTDIKTYVNGKEVTGYNIGGRTAVFIDDLAPFGTIKWSEKWRMITLR